jgi:hypothetical protein
MRLLLALLIACLAFPAMATPHCAEPSPATTMTMDHGKMHHAPAPVKPAPVHDCIGCIPPTHGLDRVTAPHRFVLDANHVQALAPLTAAAPSAPDTPPPKHLS